MMSEFVDIRFIFFPLFGQLRMGNGDGITKWYDTVSEQKTGSVLYRCIISISEHQRLIMWTY